MKKEEKKTIKEKLEESYKAIIKGPQLEEAKDPKKKPDQPNLFGEQDQVYNTIQEEISIIVAAIVAGQEAISKKEDQIADLQERKQRLEKAAGTVAKLRDAKLKKKEKGK